MGKKRSNVQKESRGKVKDGSERGGGPRPPPVAAAVDMRRPPACFSPHLMLPEAAPSSSRSPAPAIPLPVEALVPGYVWVVPGFFARKECENWIRFLENDIPKAYAEEGGGGWRWEHTIQRGTRYLAQRECYRGQFHDPAMAARIFTRLMAVLTSVPQHGLAGMESSGLLPVGETLAGAVGCNPNLRLYRYDRGHSFGRHVDESVTIRSDNAEEEWVTRLTALVYLSSCEGGATRFYVPAGATGRGDRRQSTKQVAYRPTPGSLLLHLHGEECLEHEGDTVTRGVKYVLRTDVAYRSSTGAK
jgi:hypothetical protein